MTALAFLALLVVWACGGDKSGAVSGTDFRFEYVTIFGPGEAPARLTIEGKKAELCRQWAAADTGMQTIGFFRTTLDDGDLKKLLKAFPSEAQVHEMKVGEPYFLFRLKAAGRHDSLRVPRRPEALAQVSGLVTMVERLETGLLAQPYRTLALEIQPAQNFEAGVPVRLHNAGVEPAKVILSDSTFWLERTDMPAPAEDEGVTQLPVVWQRVGGYSSVDTITVPADSATDVVTRLNADVTGDFLLRARFERELMPGDNPTEISGSVVSEPFRCSIYRGSESR